MVTEQEHGQELLERERMKAYSLQCAGASGPKSPQEATWEDHSGSGEHQDTFLQTRLYL